jgi:hypothetical protein
MRPLTTLVPATRALPKLLLACALLTTAGSVTAQQLTLGFDGAPSGPLPWSEQGFDFVGGGFGLWSTELISGKLSIFAFGSGFGYADVHVSRADGGLFDARSLDIVSVTGDISDVAIWTNKTGPDWVRGPSGIGTDVFTDPDFAAIGYLAISAWPPSDTSVTVVVDNLVVELVPESWTDVGGGTAGIAGTPELSLQGPLTPASTLTLDLVDGPPLAPALVFVSFASTPTPFLGGTLHAFPFLGPLIVGTDAAGEIHGSAPFPFVASGTDLWFQVGLQDATVPVFGASLSNGVKGTVP